MPSTTTSTLYWVYVLERPDRKWRYVGFSTNLEQRLYQHKTGQVQSTRPYLPVRLIYCEGCLDRDDAVRREGYLKTTGGRRFLAKRLTKFLLSKL